MEYLDAVDINKRGVTFFMANRLNRMFQNILDISGGNGTNFHIWCQRLQRGERLPLASSTKNCILGQVCVQVL